MRNIILAAALAAIAAPAAAAPVRGKVDLPPPHAIGALGDRVGATADALMDVDLGPVVDAIEPGRRHRPARLGDLAYGHDPYARERLHRSIERTSLRAEAAARQLEIVAPRLLATLADARQRLKAALRAPIGAPAQGGYRVTPEDPGFDWRAPGDYPAGPEEEPDFDD